MHPQRKKEKEKEKTKMGSLNAIPEKFPKTEKGK
jgi:hypothetical protein